MRLYRDAATRRWAEGKPGSAIANIYAMHKKLIAFEEMNRVSVWDRSGPRAKLDEAIQGQELLMSPAAGLGLLHLIQGDLDKTRRKSDSMEAGQYLSKVYTVGNNAARARQDWRPAVQAAANEVDAWYYGGTPGAARLKRALDRISRGKTLVPGVPLCDRCGGWGHIPSFAHVEGGVCFECGGSGVA
jgi:hypothetical protein